MMKQFRNAMLRQWQLFVMMLFFTAALSSAWPQDPRVRISPTHPKVPNKEMLRRMDMDLRWHFVLPLFDEQRDRLFSAQILQSERNPQLIVQTYLGYVYLIDAETGDLIWRVRPTPTQAAIMQQAAANSHSIYVVRDDSLYILDRRTGAKRLYLYDPRTKTRITYGFRLKTDAPPGTPGQMPLASPTATPVADEDTLFYTSGDRIVALNVPNPSKSPFKAPPPDADSERPSVRWILFVGKAVVPHAPIVTTSQVGAVSTDGAFLSLEKVDQYVRFRFKTGKVGAALGVHSVYNLTRTAGRETVYIASADQALYAVNLEKGELEWRFLSPRPILRKPYVNDRDVFIKTEKGSFYRIDRATGKEMWSNKTALQFLAVNRMFVYTRDAAGSMLIHDYLRGTEMAAWDFRDWHLSISNELTDRVYLANHDGQVICLANHDYQTPQGMKTTDFPIRTVERKKQKEKEK